MAGTIELARLTLAPGARWPEDIPSTITIDTGNQAILAPAGEHWKDRVAAVRDAMIYAGRFQAGRLAWSFSPVSLDCATARIRAAQWQDTGEPPVLAIIAIERVADSFRTRGLGALLGQDIEIRGGDAAAVLAARLARALLIEGPTDRAAVVDQNGIRRAVDYRTDGELNIHQVLMVNMATNA